MKIKKLLILILSIITIIMCVCFAGCKEENNTPIDTSQPTEIISSTQISSSAFVLISTEKIVSVGFNNATIYTVYHKETKIVYMITIYNNGSSSGSVSVIIMVDENGKPLLYEGDNNANMS